MTVLYLYYSVISYFHCSMICLVRVLFSLSLVFYEPTKKIKKFLLHSICEFLLHINPLTFKPSEAIDSMNNAMHKIVTARGPFIVNPLMKRSPMSVPHQNPICMCIFSFDLLRIYKQLQ